jgi:Zn-dependent M28 family amino/carboxypeptidase
LRKTVKELAGPLAPRSPSHPEKLDAAASYIESTLRDAGYEVATQPFDANGKSVHNIEADLPGGAPVIVVGAHYDAVTDFPGANDNGSGTAAILEIARLLRPMSVKRTVRFVLFVNEEPPYFQTEYMGSRVHARRARERGDPIALVINIDMIGCYRDEPSYGFPLNVVLGKRGDFVAFLANPSSRTKLRQAVAFFRESTQFPSEGMILPEFYSDGASSDQVSYWREGYPAVYVTDTGPVRGCPHHTSADTPEAMDFGRMARVVGGLARTVEGFANAIQ